MDNKPPQPTHLVSFWGVRCYFNDETNDLWGINFFWDILIIPASWFQNAMAAITQFFFPWWEHEGFRFKVLKEF